MSKARHERYKVTGPEKQAVQMTPKVYSGQDSNVDDEAMERKNGGRTKRKRGGMIDGMPGKKRMDRPGRKSGGGIGANKTPLSTAATITPATDHKAEVSGNSDPGK
jgi:hypothetical protein